MPNKRLPATEKHFLQLEISLLSNCVENLTTQIAFGRALIL